MTLNAAQELKAHIDNLAYEKREMLGRSIRLEIIQKVDATYNIIVEINYRWYECPCNLSWKDSHIINWLQLIMDQQ